MIKITAVVATRNSCATIDAVVRHLLQNNINIVVIDHQSNDGTRAILKRYETSHCLQRVHIPFNGVFSLKDQLIQKKKAFETHPSDWYIHLDADEILEPYDTSLSLRDFIAKADQEGYEVIDCDEFVLVPESEIINYAGTNFVETMNHYYHFAPPHRTLHRIFKATVIFDDLINSGGHSVNIQKFKKSPQHVRLRHYIGLSYNHIKEQYLSRVFEAQELKKGFHLNRVATSTSFIKVVPTHLLSNQQTDGLIKGRPLTKHPIFNQNPCYIAPDFIDDSYRGAPMPFIVAVGRSGTTLLRLLIDAHPDIAITPETHWLLNFMRKLNTVTPNLQNALTALKGNQYWKDMGIDDVILDHLIMTKKDPSDIVRAIYRAYAHKHSKPRYGDKTPIHGLSMIEIAKQLPEAHFIHIIRDGRDVAVSYRNMWFGPGKNTKDAAIFWMWRIREMRQQAQFLPHYFEVKYEDLVHNPETILKQVGNFIQLPFHVNQLTAYLTAENRLKELQSLQLPDRKISKEERVTIFNETKNPPNPSRIGRWKRELTKQEIEAFHSVAGNFLLDLGYNLK